MEYILKAKSTKSKRRKNIQLVHNLYVNKRIIYGALILNPNANKTNMRFVNTSRLQLLL